MTSPNTKRIPRTPKRPSQPRSLGTPSTANSNLSSPEVVRNRRITWRVSSPSPSPNKKPLTYTELDFKCETLSLASKYRDEDILRLKNDRQVLEEKHTDLIAQYEGIADRVEELKDLRRQKRRFDRLQKRMRSLRHARAKAVDARIHHTRHSVCRTTKRLRASDLRNINERLRVANAGLLSQSKALQAERQTLLNQISDLEDDVKLKNWLVQHLQGFVERAVGEKTQMEMRLANRVKNLSAGDKASLKKVLDEDDREREGRVRQIRSMPETSSRPIPTRRHSVPTDHRSNKTSARPSQEPAQQPTPTREVPADEVQTADENAAAQATIVRLEAEVERERFQREQAQAEEETATMLALLWTFFCIFIVITCGQSAAERSS